MSKVATTQRSVNISGVHVTGRANKPLKSFLFAEGKSCMYIDFGMAGTGIFQNSIEFERTDVGRKGE
jgi:hypothetical protein